MSRRNIVSSQDLLKVPAKLRSIVTLHHGDRESPPCLGGKDGLNGQSLPQRGGYRNVCHSTVKIDDGVVIQFSAAIGINVVNGIYLYQFTRTSHNRASWIVSAYSWLPGAVKAVMAPQDAAHTAETDAEVVSGCDVMPDHLGAAL